MEYNYFSIEIIFREVFLARVLLFCCCFRQGEGNRPEKLIMNYHGVRLKQGLLANCESSTELRGLFLLFMRPRGLN